MRRNTNHPSSEGTFLIHTPPTQVSRWIEAKDWCYVPSAKVIMDKTNAGDDEAAIRRYVIDKMIEGAKANRVMLVDKQNAFRWAVGLVAAEIAVLAGLLLLRLGAIL